MRWTSKNARQILRAIVYEPACEYPLVRAGDGDNVSSREVTIDGVDPGRQETTARVGEGALRRPPSPAIVPDCRARTLAAQIECRCARQP